jgi:UDP-glucose:(heptosyl)LPS alpha-1,3-glucosyltransferase
MRIALIARGCRPGAGIELYTHELAERLAARHEVHVLTDPHEAQAGRAQILPIVIPRRPRWYSILAFSAEAGHRALRGQYDIVHTQGSDGTWGDVVTAHACHPAGMRASLKLNPSCVNRVRKCASPAHRAIVSLERRTFAGARQVIAVSHQVGRQVRAAYLSGRRTPVTVIYPGVDGQRYVPAALPAFRTAIRRRLGLADQAVVFTLVANSPRLKGAIRLLQALARVKSPHATLLFASASGHDPALAQLARRLGLAGRLHFFAAGRDALAAYAAADVYAALPEYEAFGLAVLEAMACGRPVILTRNAGAAELLADGREACLLPALAGAEDVAAALERLAGDPGLRARMGAAARKTAERCTWDRMAAQVERVYEEVVENKRRK